MKKAAKNKGTAQSSKTACIIPCIPSHNHTILLFMQKHDKLRPNSWSPVLHCVSRTNSQHLRSPRQRCAGTNGDGRKGMIYHTLSIRCGWRTLVAGLQQWQQVMATQSTSVAREGSVITRRPDCGLCATSAQAGTTVSVSEYATRRQKQLVLRAMPAYTTRRLHTTRF